MPEASISREGDNREIPAFFGVFFMEIWLFLIEIPRMICKVIIYRADFMAK